MAAASQAAGPHHAVGLAYVGDQPSGRFARGILLYRRHDGLALVVVNVESDQRAGDEAIVHRIAAFQRNALLVRVQRAGC